MFAAFDGNPILYFAAAMYGVGAIREARRLCVQAERLLSLRDDHFGVFAPEPRVQLCLPELHPTEGAPRYSKPSPTADSTTPPPLGIA